MELRVLRYFLAVAREESISAAAQALHLTQPTLSRQLMDLEAEVGRPLFLRGRRITLTEHGVLLRRRAEEILALADKTAGELAAAGETVAGDIYIGAGETQGVHVLTRAAMRLRERYPLVRFHISSGDTMDVAERLDQGLIDFGLMFEPIDRKKYGVCPLPVWDAWGVLMRRDSPLAQKEAVAAGDLADLPLIVSRLMGRRDSLDPRHPLGRWFQQLPRPLNIAATYSLLYNASLMVEDGLGYALCLGGIINTAGESGLCFRPLTPEAPAHMGVVWKKQQVFSKSAQRFLAVLNGGEP